MIHKLVCGNDKFSSLAYIKSLNLFSLLHYRLDVFLLEMIGFDQN